MIKKQFLGLALVATLLGGWVTYSMVSYFTHQVPPHVQLFGIEHEGNYRGIVSCALKGQSSYKVSHINLFVDGKPLDLQAAKNIGAKEFDRPFTLDTFALAHGKHTLEIEAVDTSYNCNKSHEKWEFYVDNKPLKAAFLQTDFKVDQGRTIHVQVQANKKLAKAEITFKGKTYNCTPESEYSKVYECFIPTDCEDQPNEYLMSANIQDDVKNDVSLDSKVQLKQAIFKKARGFALAKDKLETEKEVSMSSKILDEALEKWLVDSPKEKLWTGSFVVPMEVQRVTTPFGEVRTTAEKGRYHHAAVDLINVPRCVVWATQRGKVIIKDRFLMTGNTVVLDHGLGVTSLYCHLEDCSDDIEVGDIINKGTPVGRMGKTGYASGYHLHWEVRVDNQKVDPMQWTKKTF